jgi:hypothetical protein
MPSFVAAFSREQLIAAVRVADFYTASGGGGGSVAYQNAVTGKALVAQDTLGGNPVTSALGQNAIDIQPTRSVSGAQPVGARGTESVVVGFQSGTKYGTPGSINIGTQVRDLSDVASAQGNIMIGKMSERSGIGATDGGADISIGYVCDIRSSAGNNTLIGSGSSIFYAVGASCANSVVIGPTNSVVNGTSGTIASEGLLCIGTFNTVSRVESGTVIGQYNDMTGATADISGCALIGHTSFLTSPTIPGITRLANGVGGNQASIDVISGATVGGSLVELGASRFAGGGANTSHRYAIADGGCQAVTITSVTAVVVPNNATTIYVRGTFAGAGTVTLPAAPIFGQEVILSVESSTLTSLTVNANTGQSRIGAGTMSFAQGSFSRWRYGGIQSAPDTAWRRVG